MRRVLSVVILIATSLAIGLGIASSPASALARGFTDVQLVNPPGNPLSSPTAVIALPGNRGLVLEKGGAVRVLLAAGRADPHAADGRPRPAAAVSRCSQLLPEPPGSDRIRAWSSRLPAG